jgi:hypothetical protein
MNNEAFEELGAIVACLRDDAAQLRDENVEDERAENMEKAADALERFHKAAAELLIHCEASEDACYGTLGISYVRDVLSTALGVPGIDSTTPAPTPAAVVEPEKDLEGKR